MFRQPHGLFPGSAQSHELANNQVLKVGAIRIRLDLELMPTADQGRSGIGRTDYFLTADSLHAPPHQQKSPS